MKNILENYDLGNWLYGLFAAVIGGGANAVVGGISLNMIDPQHFNARTEDFYKLVGAMFCISATISFFMYLKQTPLPKMVSKTVTTLTVEKTIQPEQKPQEPDKTE